MNAFDILHIAVLLTLIVTAVLAVRFKDLLASVISLAAFSLALSVEFFLLHAPDVAIAEAGIGAALTTAIYIFALRSTRRMEEEPEDG
ncbi:MAG: hydrogenase subunit MbhD domain-containing protein [Candidatus Woesearchaeota archaeon]